MCTVTFIPSRDSYYITSNRDESPGRQATGISSRHQAGMHAIHFPLDELSGGSWIALSGTGRVVCLLNGAFEPFVPGSSYRMSRGQVVMEATTAPDSMAFLEHFVLDEIAPFTLLIYENHVLRQLIWDGHERHLETLPVDQPRIWSSVTLYGPEVRAWRKSRFEEWLQTSPQIDRESIIAFHQMANSDPSNDFVMNRQDKVKTLSVTSVLIKPHSGSMLHLALDQLTREEILVQYGQPS